MFRRTKSKPKAQESNELFKARTAIKRQIDRLNHYRDAVTQSQPGQMDLRQQLAAAIVQQSKEASLGVSISPRDVADVEIVYDVAVTKKSKHTLHVKAKKERYIALSLIPSRQAALLHHYSLVHKFKDVQLELQQTWLLSDLVAVDFGDSCEVVFMFDTPYSFFTNSSVDRDEIVWIVLNLCEALCKFRPQTSVDSDVLNFTATTNNFLARHPLLQKYMTRSSKATRTNNGPDSTLLLEDENEAADLLTSLSWHEHSSIELASMLRQQQEDLQRDNIEFLLEWEEIGDDGDEPNRMSRLNATAPSYFRPLRFGQTEQLLVALDELDVELGELDGWLETQVDHLSEVQHELLRIEDENNTLESQWQNFSRLKAVIQQIMDHLLIPMEQLQTLRNPERIVELAFHMPNFNETPTVLQPLLDAIQRLHKGLFRTEVAGEENMASWLQLSTIAAVRDQEQKLHELRLICCDKLGNSLETVFRRILEHRALDDERAGATVKVKSFDFSEILDTLPQNNSSRNVNPLTQLQTAQKLYHGVVNDFIPVVDGLVSLDMRWLSALKTAYVQTTADHLYSPLVKQYFKDLQTQIPHQANRLSKPQAATRMETLNASLELSPRASEASSTPSSRPPLRSNVSLLFGSQSNIDSTFSFALAGFISCLKHMRNLVQKEERFLSALFDTYSETPEDPQPQTEILFVGFKKRILRFVSSDEFVEGLDLLSMLRVIDDGFREDDDTDANGRPLAARSEYFNSVLLELQVVLTQRFNEFMAQQENWISSFKADTKKGGVLSPFLKLPVLVDYVERSVDGKRIEAAVTAYQKLCNALFSCLERLSSQNIKYSDTVRIVNYDYFVQTIGSRGIPTLQRFVDQAVNAKSEAQERYVRWMVRYELSQLTALMDRLEDVAESYGDSSVGIYVKKDAVHTVVRNNERTMTEGVGNILQRLKKHFANDTDPTLMEEIWEHVQKYLSARYKRYETIVHAAYQLRVSPTTAQVEALLRSLKPA